MNIYFCCQHDYWGGLHNTGGSRTIILSAKTLNKLGHNAKIVTRSDKHTWIKHDKPLKTIPKDADACIACSVSDIKPMLKSMPKKAKAYWWCRLIENHSMSKKKILYWAKKVNVLVNSENLRDWFEAHGIKTTIVYQGVDLKKWKDKKKHSPKTIGFLVSSKPRKHFDFIKMIIRTLGKEYNYVGYGADLNASIKAFVKKHFLYFKKNADQKELNRIYNMAGIWVATSTKEGLHNPPIEAALSGCAVVYPLAPLAGCSDHCYPFGHQYEALNLEDAIKVIKKAISLNINSGISFVEPHKDFIRDIIGSREKCMKRIVRILK